MLEQETKELILIAHRMKRKIDRHYEVLLFFETWRYLNTIAVDKAKNVEKALRKYADIYKIPVLIKYYWIDRKQPKPRYITNVKYRMHLKNNN